MHRADPVAYRPVPLEPLRLPPVPVAVCPGVAQRRPPPAVPPLAVLGRGLVVLAALAMPAAAVAVADLAHPAPSSQGLVR
ncbi:MAG: hypothetical protein PGN34_03120 [Methylobacterium frigidaeris]